MEPRVLNPNGTRSNVNGVLSDGDFGWGAMTGKFVVVVVLLAWFLIVHHPMWKRLKHLSVKNRLYIAFRRCIFCGLLIIWSSFAGLRAVLIFAPFHIVLVALYWTFTGPR